jgi:hypothetical protein
MRMQDGMEPLTVLVAIGVAGYVAIMLAYVARVDLGVSNEHIRIAAILCAMLIAVGIALDFLGKRPRKAE